MTTSHAESGQTRRAAVVMAATQGLGRGSAEALARDGYDLLICARSAEAVDAAAGELAAAGTRVEGMTADVSKPGDLDAVFARADECFGRLDALVANAGGPPPGSFLDATDDLWERAFQLTLMSAVRAMRQAVPRMRRNGFGRIVVIGSSSVKQPIDGLVLSNAFRPALVGTVKTLAREVAPDGITVNIVSPGRVDTERVRSLDRSRAERTGQSYEDVRAASEASIPAGHYGSPDDVGALVAFLCSERAGYITGQSILVDGGMVSALP